jgi:hypothetical protein
MVFVLKLFEGGCERMLFFEFLFFCFFSALCERPDSNHRPTDFEPHALPLAHQSQ